MADIDISVGELPEAEYFDGESILLVENQGIAERVSGAQIKGFLRSGNSGGGGSGGGVSKASELENDVPFVSAVEQSLTDEQKAQARKNIGSSHISVEYTNIGSASFVQMTVVDADGKRHIFDPRGSSGADGGVWVPEYNEETGVIEWEYHNPTDFYPAPNPVPIPTKTSDLDNDVPFVSATAQTLTEEQKQQAQENIGLGGLVVSAGGDTLEWDGNIEGLTAWDGSALGAPLMYWRVSDATPTVERISSGTLKISNGIVLSGSALISADMGDVIFGVDGIFISVVKDNPVVGGVEFPEKGFYCLAGEYRLSSLTIPGYTGFAKKKIKEEYIPESVPNIQTAAVGQTIVVSEVDADGKPTKWEAADVGGGGANYLLTLSTEEADAQANSDAITAAIAEHKHVVLQRGDYPVKPGIVVESGKLDMNGSRFYTVDYKSETPLVYLKGESPEICNGELEGSYDLADNEAGYSLFEKECLIRPEGVNNAYIHHMDLHNNWGYCISPGETWERILVDSATKPGNVNDMKYTTDAISIPEGYKFIAAAGSIGFNYIISVSPVTYQFYNADGVGISTSYGVPRKRIVIPAGAASVKITTHTNTDGVIPYYVYFTNYEETLVVSDCNFRNFHSLGMANMPGPTTVTRCSFVEGGKPRSDVYGTYRATTGGIDIEDIQTPEFIMSDCWSRDCAKLLMFGGYKGVVTNCTGDAISIYRGWECSITNCNVRELTTNGSPCRISTNGVHADAVSIRDENIKDVRGDISTFRIDSMNLCRFDSFVVDVDSASNSQHAVIYGKVNGRIKGVTGTGITLKECSSAPGSRIEFDSTVTGSNGNYYGAVKVTGDTYGLVSNVPFFPNGQTIHDSIFNIGAQVTAYGWADVTWSGGFKNCVFNLTGGTFFRLFAKSPTEPVELTFEGCTINNADKHLFNFVPFAGSTITFKNCTIADESKLFNGNTSGITINILAGGEGGVDIDDSLTVEGAAADAKAVGDALAAKMPVATTAKVGQYFKVSAVDANGAVTAVEAVEAVKIDASLTTKGAAADAAKVGAEIAKLEGKVGGAGGNAPWRVLCKVTLDETNNPNGVNEIATTTFADGTSLEGAGISEIKFRGSMTLNEDVSYNYAVFEINDQSIGVGQNFAVKVGQTIFFGGEAQLLCDGMLAASWQSSHLVVDTVKGTGIVTNNIQYGDEIAKVRVKGIPTAALFTKAELVVVGR